MGTLRFGANEYHVDLDAKWWTQGFKEGHEAARESIRAVTVQASDDKFDQCFDKTLAGKMSVQAEPEPEPARKYRLRQRLKLAFCELRGKHSGKLKPGDWYRHCFCGTAYRDPSDGPKQRRT